MNKIRALFLFLLVPQLIYGVFFIKDHDKLLDKVTMYWNQHGALLKEFGELPNPLAQREKINLLQEAMMCCEHAIHYCDKILEKIEEKSKSDRKSWADIKKLRKGDKKRFAEEIAHIRTLIDQTEENGKVYEITFFCNRVIEKGKEGAAFVEESEKDTLDDDERLHYMHQAIASYSEAQECFQRAGLLAQEYFPGQSVHVDQEVIEELKRCEAALPECQRRASVMETKLPHESHRK